MKEAEFVQEDEEGRKKKEYNCMEFQKSSTYFGDAVPKSRLS